MAKRIWWTVWSGLSAAWVGYLLWFIWFRWSDGPASMASPLDYAITAAVFIVPPLALVLLGIGAGYGYRRNASLTRSAN